MKIQTFTTINFLPVILLLGLFFCSTPSQIYAQGLPLTVLDEQTKEALIGVHVQSEEDGFRAYTNEKGAIYVKGVSLDDYLVFSYLGYQDERRTLKEIIKSSDTIYMSMVSIGIEPVKIIARDLSGERRENIANQVMVVDAKKIALLNPQNSADLLQASGAFVQKSQMGGGSPIIRGFEANKLLIVVDGVRLNNAIYRNGHLQNVITIDNAVLDRTEIVQGPASVIYGSDALGGVMHFISKDPRLALRKGQEEVFEGSMYVRHSTANNEKTGHIDFNYGTKKLALLSSLSYSKYGDLKVGSTGMEDYPGFGLKYFNVESTYFEDKYVPNPDPYIQMGTAYWQVDALQKIKYQYKNDLSFMLNFQYSTTSDIPRYDQLSILEITENEPDITTDNDTLPKFATWNYGPQTRFFLSLKARYTPDYQKYFDEANVILSVQKVDEDRIKRRFNKTFEEHQEEDVYVTAINADFTKAFNKQKNQVLLYGTELVYNNVLSNAYGIFQDGIIDPRQITRYPNGGSRMFTAAVYANYRQRFGDKLNFMAGSRYTYALLNSTFLPDSLIILPFTEIGLNKGALTGSLSISYEFLKDFHFDAVVATAFRSPNVDDFGKVRSKGGYVTVPNENLGPEKSLNMEASLTKEIGSSFLISGTYFYTYLFNAIVRDDFTLIDPISEQPTSVLYIDGGYDSIQANVNGGEAYINGVSASLQFNILRNLQLKSSFNIVKGVNVTKNSPLEHIPPIYGQTALAYETNKMEVTFLTRYNGWKHIEDYAPLGSSDNVEYATVDGTPSWITYNVYFKYELSPRLNMNLACENITDRHYRSFASGISAPGRNFIFTLRKTF